MYRLTNELLGFFQIAGLDFLLHQFTISNQLSVGCPAGSDRNDRGCKWVYYFTYLQEVHKLLLGVKVTPDKKNKKIKVLHIPNP